MSRYHELIKELRGGIESEALMEEAADEMEKADARIQELLRERAELLRFAERVGPVYRHKNGALYQAADRDYASQDYKTGDRTPFGSGLVTDDIAEDEEYVLYRNSKGEYFSRPARLFDEPTRFRRLHPAG